MVCAGGGLRGSVIGELLPTAFCFHYSAAQASCLLCACYTLLLLITVPTTPFCTLLLLNMAPAMPLHPFTAAAYCGASHTFLLLLLAVVPATLFCTLLLLATLLPLFIACYKWRQPHLSFCPCLPSALQFPHSSIL